MLASTGLLLIDLIILIDVFFNVSNSICQFVIVGTSPAYKINPALRLAPVRLIN